MSPTVHLEPGVVRVYASPTTGLIDVGRYPNGTDNAADASSSALRAACYDSVVRPDIIRWKYAKLLSNLGNAVEAVCGPPAQLGPIGDAAVAEGRRVLEAAGIDLAPPDVEARTAAIQASRSEAQLDRAGRVGRAWNGALARSRRTT